MLGAAAVAGAPGAQGQISGGMGGLCVPVFTYGQPSVFFKQFSRYAKVTKLSSQECFDTMCFCMGACSQGQWLADLIEREVAPQGDVAAVIAAVQARVQSALQPEVLKSAIMADVEKASLKPGQSCKVRARRWIGFRPRHYAGSQGRPGQFLCSALSSGETVQDAGTRVPASVRFLREARSFLPPRAAAK